MSLWTRLKDLGPRTRARKERDLEREIQSHLDLEAEESGHYGARRAFGNTVLVKEDVRAAWGWTRVEQLARDVGFGLRQVRRNPAFSAIAIATLALGIGANTAMFSAVDAVLIRPLPYARRRPTRHDLGRRHEPAPAPGSSSRRRRNGRSGDGTTRCSRISPRASPATRRSRTTASPRSCPPVKSPATSGPCSAPSHCSDASSPRTKTPVERGSWSSATGSGSGASPGHPTSWAARSR